MLTEILASITVVIIPLVFTIPWTFVKCWDVWWAYVDWKIYLCEWENSNEFNKQHEIGHLVEEKYLTENQRNQYKALYEKHHKLWVKAFKREYGYKNWQESFAEDFGSWKTNEKVNIYTKQRIKLITSFLK